MTTEDARQSDARWSSTRFALVTAVATWTIYVAVATARCIIYGFPNPRWLIERHIVTALIAIALSAGLHRLLRSMEHSTIEQRLAIALATALPAAMLLSVFNYNAIYVFAPIAYVHELGLDLHPGIVGEVLDSSLENYFVLAGWAVLWTAVSHAMDTQALLRRTATSEAAARAAELRALRLQLDPHFLFNALNTVSGLIVAGASEDADHAVEALSAFLRATLEADASADVSLADELHLQRLYLAVEQIRFGERLSVSFDIPEALRTTPVPALILQPLVENSIRHAVARTSHPVEVTIAARAERDGLCLSVEDNGPGNADPGHRIGLANVAARLALRYEDQARLDHRRTERGTTRTAIQLPLGGHLALGSA